MAKKISKIKIGVSSCLLGIHVRYDGNHRQDRFLTDVLAPFVEWVSVCPEYEVGMGVPREKVHLMDKNGKPHMMGSESGKDWTTPMNRYAKKRTQNLLKENLCGYIFKKGSPSCGIKNVGIVTANNKTRQGNGLFVDAFVKQNPLVPIEDEGRLHDAKIRENFICRIFSYARLKQLLQSSYRRGDFVDFHAQHKYLLLSHSTTHYKALGKLVAKIKQLTPTQFKEKYSQLFMEAFTRFATRAKHFNVLQHMHGYFKKSLPQSDRAELLQTLEDYKKGHIPLIVPMTLIKHFVRKYDVKYLKNQVYLNPHPKELMIRNHV